MRTAYEPMKVEGLSRVRRFVRAAGWTLVRWATAPAVAVHDRPVREPVSHPSAGLLRGGNAHEEAVRKHRTDRAVEQERAASLRRTLMLPL